MAGRQIEAVLKSNKLPQIRQRFPTVLSDIIGKATLDTYAKSQITVPVRKDQSRVRGGALKNSGQVTFNKGSFTGTVSYNIYYAVYVHEGTYRMPARPFLENALKDTVPALKAALATLESRLG